LARNRQSADSGLGIDHAAGGSNRNRDCPGRHAVSGYVSRFLFRAGFLTPKPLPVATTYPAPSYNCHSNGAHGLAFGAHLELARIWRSPNKSLHNLAVVVRLIFLFQLALGVFNVVLLAPMWLQIVHLLTADVLWVTLVLLATKWLSTQGAR